MMPEAGHTRTLGRFHLATFLDMDLWRRRRRRAVTVAAVVGLLAGGAVVGVASHGAAPVTIRNLHIAVVDGPRNGQHVVLDATFFIPRGHGRVPAILLAHGFGESKTAVRPQAEYLARAGFAVLTWSARGSAAGPERRCSNVSGQAWCSHRARQGSVPGSRAPHSPARRGPAPHS